MQSRLGYQIKKTHENKGNEKIPQKCSTTKWRKVSKFISTYRLSRNFICQLNSDGKSSAIIEHDFLS